MVGGVGVPEITLSREVSHFLLNAWLLQDHPELDAAKRSHFALPTVDALIINETLYLDPAVGLYRTKLTDQLMDTSPILQKLRREKIVKPLPIQDADYRRMLEAALDDTTAFLLRMLTEGRPLRAYNYFYLLESPLSVFVRESDLLLSAVKDAHPKIKMAWPRLRGFAPFVLSVYLGIRVYRDLGLPTLSSPLAHPFVAEILSAEFQDYFEGGTPLVRQMIDSLVAAQSGLDRACPAVRVPDFTAICSHECSSSIDLIERALTLRSDRHCQAFRRELWSVFDHWRESPCEPLTQAILRRYNDATHELVQSLDRSLMRRFADSTFTVLLTAPLAMLDPVSSLVGKAGIGLAREMWSQRRAKERFGWLFFTYENLRLPNQDVG